MTKVKINGNGSLLVPDCVTIPFITGDGVGVEITPAMRRVVDEAVRKCYGGKRRIDWFEVLAGQKAYDMSGVYLPEATMAAFREYHIGI